MLSKTAYLSFLGLLLSLVISLPGICAEPPTSPPAATTELNQASIAELHQQLLNGSLSVQTLTQYFLDRIAKLDQAGPHVNSVIQINPDALKIARQLDAEPKNLARSQPLYGIPVLLKDNIDTGDQMLTTAGSLALMGAPASQDATLVAKLRKAGAVILGKTNLSEWANFRSEHSTSGWSGEGGLTHNPYILDRNACGSSSGSAAAVAAGFATVAIGTETDGSIVCPSSVNGVVGIKPSLGLVSRTGIIPISHNQDTAGPIARNVADAATVLSVISGSDPRDPYTTDARYHATDYSRFLNANALKGKRIGVVRELAGYDPNVDRILDHTIAVLRAHGAIVIDPVKVPHLNDYGKAEQTVLLYDFKHDLNAYLATRKGIAVHNLAKLIAFDKSHAAQEMPWFGQDEFIAAEAKGPLIDKAYRDALARAKRLSGPEGIDVAMKKYRLDALLAPTTGPAWTTDLVNGDHVTGGSSSPAAVAGYPDITVPAGFVHCLPVGMSFFAGKWSEPKLISIAYAFEQATHVYRSPQFLPTVEDCTQ
ncbi:MAG: amidase [Gammaproteobacteria bacterium]|nr:amidase [Gammaproteobacteria bacterium]MBU6508653.1 amidase [Gammaproteobacteria bacterium]MDE1982992.1 amidase [Gammaproteobacteria bacterium]MDE2107741.1 amidase [Gammaproteobacteria bacterium]MDE2461591.1 amidase [Gammaproteobacteria bacterium]